MIIFVILGGLFFFVGIGIFFSSPISKTFLQKRYPEEVECKVTQIVSREAIGFTEPHTPDMYYAPIYQYTFGGKSYICPAKTFRSYPYKNGEILIGYIDPEEPDDVHIAVSSTWTINFLKIFGGCFAASGLLFFIIGIAVF